MSQKQISLSHDLQKLQDQGYEIEIRSGHLLVHSIPYVNSKCEIAYGTLVSPLTLAGQVTTTPGDHKTWFIGDHPCTKDGALLKGIQHGTYTEKLAENLEVHHSFSNKPAGGGYPDYFAKMTRYIEIILHQARAVNPNVIAQTYKPIVTMEDDSVFHYSDSASSRAGIAGLAIKLAMPKVCIIGLGGTGSYILDMIAKTHVREIHLFDGDRFLQHNAFRSPGAASLVDLSAKPFKVSYLVSIYEKMRKGIFAHESYITNDNVTHLTEYDFVFICVDKASVRKLISETLESSEVPFIDVGMDVQLLKVEQTLIGSCRITTSTPKKRDHFARRVSLQEDSVNDMYAANIQIADLNALNAILAIIKWKKYCGFYQDLIHEHQSVYDTNAHHLIKDERFEADPLETPVR